MTGSWWAVSLSLLGRDIKIRQYIKGEQILEKVSASYRRGFFYFYLEFHSMNCYHYRKYLQKGGENNDRTL